MADPYPSTLNVAAFGGTLVDVNVTSTGLSHTFPIDLEILLVAPSGEAVLLMRGVGGGNPGVTDVDLTFDDEAGHPCPSGAASDSLIDSSLSGAPFVSSATGTGLWSEGDAFVGVQSSVYWSATGGTLANEKPQ